MRTSLVVLSLLAGLGMASPAGAQAPQNPHFYTWTRACLFTTGLPSPCGGPSPLVYFSPEPEILEGQQTLPDGSTMTYHVKSLAQFGLLRVYASSSFSIVGPDTHASTTAGARFTDVITIDDPELDGQPGLLHVAYMVDGTLTAEEPGRAGLRLDWQLGTAVPIDGGFDIRFPVFGREILSTSTSRQFVAPAFSFVFGQPFAVSFTVGASTGRGPTDGGPVGSATSDFYNTVYLSGLVATDASGRVASSPRYSSASGTQYSVSGLVLPILAAIDIMPGDHVNPINRNSAGRTPVAILSSESFDAPARVRQDSLTFGRTGNEASLAFCNPDGEDVNADGRRDLVCHFLTRASGFESGDTHGVLKGRTVDDVPLTGTDVVRVLR